MTREDLIRAIEQYARTNPGAVVILVEDNPDGSVAIHAAPNVAGLIDIKKQGANLTSGQAYALSALLHIARTAKAERLKQKPTKLWLPPGMN